MVDFSESKSGPNAAETAPAPDQSTTEVDVATAKSTKSPAFQFYPRDFLSSAKVDQMSMTERGAYITLLSRCWLDNGLPTDLAELAGMVRMKPSQFNRMWTSGQIARCFVERGGRFHNDRLDRERKVQAAYRRKQKDNADSGWQRRRNATALPDVAPSHPSGNAPLSLSASSSSSAFKRETQAGAPIHTTHKNHAACGRVCVPADLHSRFVRARNHDHADRELRDWYLAVDVVWTDGAKKDEPVGGNDYAFWRARFSERWPSADDVAQLPRRDNRPAWTRKAGA